MISLPTSIQDPVWDIDHVSMVIYGAPKIGKSTFCSRFPHAIFMATEPGLSYLRTYNVRVHDWQECHEFVDLLEKGCHSYKTIVIDTVDVLWAFCAEYIRKSRDVETLTDLAYGKGKDLATCAFSDLITRMVRLDMGLVFVSHAQMAEVDTIQGKVGKFLPTIPDRARSVVLPLVDVIGFATSEPAYTKDGARTERRLLRVAPSSLWEAGDRSGRLRDPLPLSYYIFKKFYEGEKPDGHGAQDSTAEQAQQKE